MTKYTYTYIENELLGRYGRWPSMVVEELIEDKLQYNINVGNDTDVAENFAELLNIINYWIYNGHKVSIDGFEFQYSSQEIRIINAWIKALQELD